MANESGAFDTGLMRENMEALAANPYPGRGIILGVSELGDQAVQAYWVMGRSENSRNRVMVENQGEVKTEAFDASKVVDPSLIIYRAMLSTWQVNQTHIVSNGDQTDTIFDRLHHGHEPDVYSRFVGGLLERDFEPDEPNYTPRVSGITFVPTLGGSGTEFGQYAYSIIRRSPTTSKSEHTFGRGYLLQIPNGRGLCYHTYESDGNPLPSFAGSPYAVKLQDDAESIATSLWENLDEENRVALAVKTIDRKTGGVVIKLVNRLSKQNES